MKKLFIYTISFVFLMCLVGCDSNARGYKFHFRVEDGNGELNLSSNTSYNPTFYFCNDVSMCELACPDNSCFVELLGASNSYRELTFEAVPDEGYKVKEWIFNGDIVEDYNSNEFTARVTSDMGYEGIIVVKFEKI